MKKRLNKITFLIITSIVVGLFAGCGRSSEYESKSSSTGAYESIDEGLSYSNDMAVEEAEAAVADSSYSEGTSDVSAESSGGTNKVDIVANQKLIVTWDIQIQTENYDDVVASIEKSVSEYGGYIENQNENSYSVSRYAYLTVRLPKDKADEWIEKTSEKATITSKSKSSEDVTLSYVDTESRLKALKTERDSLLAILEKAESVEAIIAVQSELNNVNYQIEYYESSLRMMDNKVDYTTVNISIDEVTREVPVETTMGQEIAEKFLSSIDGLKSFFRNLIVGLLGNSVIIVIVIAVVFAVVKIVKHIGLKRVKNEVKNIEPSGQGDN
ncbi:MAG: DUF4349 domain-containing protein [Lachnospiraceae bacterium]|nr:DUF4349 domain-containing protein [Lachnospiraceae bacterium]